MIKINILCSMSGLNCQKNLLPCFRVLFKEYNIYSTIFQTFIKIPLKIIGFPASSPFFNFLHWIFLRYYHSLMQDQGLCGHPGADQSSSITCHQMGPFLFHGQQVPRGPPGWPKGPPRPPHCQNKWQQLTQQREKILLQVKCFSYAVWIRKYL